MRDVSDMVSSLMNRLVDSMMESLIMSEVTALFFKDSKYAVKLE